MTPKISVILPVYNAQESIGKSIESILTQFFEDFELIIINDGSTDNTLLIISSFKDHRIRICTTPNRGIARALNFGIKLAKADIIARMDADDISLPDRLEKQLDYLNSNPDVGLVSCKVEYGGDRNANLGYALYVDHINKLMTHETMFIKRFQESPIAHPSVMYRKCLIEQFGGYAENKTAEDYELWLRWMNKGVKFGKINGKLLIWNDLPNRISRNNVAYSEAEFLKIKAKYLYKELSKKRRIFNVWIWGTGRKVNTSIKPFEQLGFKIKKFIDVKPTIDNKRIIHYKNLPSPGDFIILSFVKDRIGKVEIEKYLIDNGFTENEDFYLMN